VKLTFCATCSSRDDLQYHRLITRSEAGSDDERTLITLCGSCHAKLNERQANSARGAATAAERARAFAERLRPILAPLAGLSANAAAQELTRRGVATARGGLWSAGAVIAIRKRLEAAT
jgi:hypothetical protein